jgi:hypothetical protein
MDASKAPARTVTNFKADIDGEGNKTALDFVLQTNQHLQGLLAKEKSPDITHKSKSASDISPKNRDKVPKQNRGNFQVIHHQNV